MKAISAWIAGGGGSILVSGVLLLGVAPAIESAFAPQPAPTATETASPTETPTPGETATPEPEEEILGCEKLLALDSRPEIFDSPRVGQRVEEVADSFPGADASHSLTVAPEVNVSEYFARLGCAEEGKQWAVVTLSDDYALDVVADRNQASYDSALNLDSSTFALTSLTGADYEPIEVFVTGPTGMHAVVFEIPATMSEGVFSATLTYDSSLALFYGSVELPATATFSHSITPAPFVLSERWGCSPIGEDWC